MRITSKGQVTIPKDLRDRCRLFPHTEVEFVLDGDGVRIIPARAFPGRGDAIVDHLRRHRAPESISTDQVMALTRGEADDADNGNDPG
jgi:AbrB family looped-hinge helix DNA binding protein